MKEGTDTTKRQDYKRNRSGRGFDVARSAGLANPINIGLLVNRRNMGVPGPQGFPYWELPGWSDDGFRQGYPGPKGQMKETDTTKRHDYKRHRSGREFDVARSAGLANPINDGLLVNRRRKIALEKHQRPGPDDTDSRGRRQDDSNCRVEKIIAPEQLIDSNVKKHLEAPDGASHLLINKRSSNLHGFGSDKVQQSSVRRFRKQIGGHGEGGRPFDTRDEAGSGGDNSQASTFIIYNSIVTCHAYGQGSVPAKLPLLKAQQPLWLSRCVIADVHLHICIFRRQKGMVA